jgi:putative flippase GtrA
LSPLARQILRFALVGGAASATHFVVALSLAHFAHAAPWAANIAAFLTALIVSYLGNSILTFEVEARRAGAFAKFAALSAVGFVLNQTTVVLLTGPAHWPYWAALCVVLILVPPMTFVLSKYWALAERTPR